ncbi:MAG: DUF58 domain-containing protein [Chloroflexi bacterium]|nr:DUF58 domain-containing protein [Chloroflexota bacterium]
MISLLPVLVGILLLAMMFKVAFLYQVLYVLVIVTVLSRLWSRLAVRQISVERRFEPRALHGDQIRLTLIVRNRGYLPCPWIRVHDRLPLAIATAANVDHVFALGPGQEHRIAVETVGRQRGWFELGPVVVESGDVFGLTRVEVEHFTPDRLTVLPRIVPVNRIALPSRLPFGEVRSLTPLFSDPARTMGTRDYLTGDSIRLIHWRASAAAGRLLVRKLEPAMTLEAIVAVELANDAYDPASRAYASELAIVTAASLVSHLSLIRQEVGLIVNGVDPARLQPNGPHVIPTGKGPEHRFSLLEVLARANLADVPVLETVLARAVASLAFGQTIVVIVPRVTDGLEARLDHLRRAGFALSLIAITRPSDVNRFQAAARSPVPRHTIWRESDLEYAGDEIRRRPGAIRAA